MNKRGKSQSGMMREPSGKLVSFLSLSCSERVLKGRLVRERLVGSLSNESSERVSE